MSVHGGKADVVAPRGDFRKDPTRKLLSLQKKAGKVYRPETVKCIRLLKLPIIVQFVRVTNTVMPTAVTPSINSSTSKSHHR